MDIQFRETRFVTLMASFFSILGTFSLFSLLSYGMSVEEFNDFAIEIRYAGFVAGLASMHLGYSLVTHSREDFFDKVFPSAFWSVFILALFFGGVFSLIYSGTIGVVFWIIATAVFHVFVNSIRIQSNGDANAISIFIKFLVLVIVGWASLYIHLLDFYTLYGLITIIIMIYISIKRGFSLLYFSARKVSMLLMHTSSRMSDEFIRISFYFIPIAYAEYFLSENLALKVVLILMLVKVFESLIQSTIIHTHIFSLDKNSSIQLRYIAKVTLFLVLFFIPVVFVAQYIIDPIVQLWLGRDDIIIAKYVATTILSIPAVLLINYIKGLYENLSEHSPFLLLNTVTAVAFLSTILIIKPNLNELVFIFVLTFWVRLFFILLKVRQINKYLNLKKKQV